MNKNHFVITRSREVEGEGLVGGQKNQGRTKAMWPIITKNLYVIVSVANERFMVGGRGVSEGVTVTVTNNVLGVFLHLRKNISGMFNDFRVRAMGIFW